MSDRPTQALGSYVSDLKYKDIPQECISKLKLVLLDSIGCGLFGSTTPWAKIVNQVVMEEGGKEEAVLWANNGFKGPALMVVLGNGTMIHAFDFDDYHNSKTHPGSVVIPAALAVGGLEEVDGETFLTALAAGYEVMIRASLATGPTPSREQGWHLTGTCGTYGAAAATGKIYGLNEDELTSALGMAGTQSSGLWAFIADGAMSKRFHPGKAAQSGILGVKLAQKGFIGPSQIFEAPDGGFCRATSDNYDISKLTEGLGEIYHTTNTNIKPYAACGSNHSSIDAVLKIVRDNKVQPSDIEKVIVYNSNLVKLQTGWDYKPLSMLQAQMSLKYNVAIAILDGQVLTDQFTEERIKAPEAVELADKVEFVVDEEIDRVYPQKFSSKVDIVLRDGSVLNAYVEHPLGSPANPATEDIVIGKFKDTTKTIIDKTKQEEIIDMVKNIDKLSNVKKLSELL